MKRSLSQLLLIVLLVILTSLLKSLYLYGSNGVRINFHFLFDILYFGIPATGAYWAAKKFDKFIRSPELRFILLISFILTMHCALLITNADTIGQTWKLSGRYLYVESNITLYGFLVEICNPFTVLIFCTALYMLQKNRFRFRY